MSELAWVVIAFIAGISFTSAVAIFAQARKNNEPLTMVIIKMRPIISEVLVEAVKVYQANTMGYDALVDYCTKYTKYKVDNADFLAKEEKEILTHEFIYGILEPQLRKLWKNKIFSEL